jgi:hypothetical protein
MSTPVSVMGLSLALLLPWLCGALWIRVLLRGPAEHNLFLSLGHGYFVGMFLVTLILRLWNGAGLQLAFWPIAALLALLSIAAWVLSLRQPIVSLRKPLDSLGQPLDPTGTAAPTSPRWQSVVAGLLLALLAWRYLGLGLELVSRPLFAWDAFMNWAPKAVLWFQLGELTPFVAMEEWFGQENVYTLGNERASLYPSTVSLIQLWHMLGAGTWDSGSVFIGWVAAPVALGMGLYGQLRLARVNFLLAVIAVYLLLSLPYHNVHAVLAGYADIWLAAVFGLAVCALYEWRQDRHAGWALLWCVYAVLCMQLKNPGLTLGLVVLLAGALGSLRSGMRLRVVLGLFAVIVGLMLIGVEMQLPYLGKFVLDTWEIEVGRFGRFELQYHAVGGAFSTTFFTMINWHLLGYLVPPALLYSLYRVGRPRVPEAELLAVLGGVAFIVLVFVFTKHHKLALNFVTLNRALLYLVPAVLFCLFIQLRAVKSAKPDNA